MYKTYYNSPIGNMLLVSDNDNLIGLWLEGQKYFGNTVDEQLFEENTLSIFIKTKEWLDRYFKGLNPKISDLPLAPRGNTFRQDVWDILNEIPYGEVMTYGDIASMLALKYGKEKMSAQAVGGAVGHNPIAVIIPCHRVVAKTGSLTGYAGGLDKKIYLLEHEQCDLSKFFKPTKGTAL